MSEIVISFIVVLVILGIIELFILFPPGSPPDDPPDDPPQASLTPATEVVKPSKSLDNNFYNNQMFIDLSGTLNYYPYPSPPGVLKGNLYPKKKYPGPQYYRFWKSKVYRLGSKYRVSNSY